ncbi:MAG: hypothetical protein N3B10_05905, partial [Armatimonadetes bacterium]|nr:hypothetical protein [Armatimonadota bacterium]
SQSICLEPYLATDRLDEAEKVARRIDEPVNRLYALSGTAKAYALAKQTDRSKAIWDEVLKSSQQLTDEMRKIILRGVVYHQTEACQFQQAIETVKTHSPENEQSYLFAQIIRSQLQMNLPEEALKTLKQAGDSDELLSHFVYYFAEKHQFDRALKFARKISHSVEGVYGLSGRQKALVAVAEQQLKAGQVTSAQQTIAEILSLPKLVDEKQHQIDALIQIAFAQAAKNRLADALKITNKLNEPQRSCAVFRIVTQLTLTKKFRKATQLAEQIAQPETKVNAFIVIAWTQAETGNRQSAAANLQRALKCVDQLPDSFKPIHLETIASLLEAIGQKKRAKEMREKAQKLIAQLKEPVVGMVSIPAVGFSIEERGLIFASDVLPLDAFSALFLELRKPIAEVIALARAGKLNEALKQIRQQEESPLLKTWMLSQVAPLASGTARQQILREAEQSADGLRKPEHKAWALMQVAKAYAQSSERARAQVLLERAFQTAQKISERWQREKLLTEILKAMAQHGLTTLATRLALQTKTEENAHIAELAVVLAQVGDAANFKRLLPSCAGNLSSAYAAIGAMAWLYLDRANDLATLVVEKQARSPEFE